VLHGKIAIITGAAGGVGQAEVRLHAAEGATVIAADIAHSAEAEQDGELLRSWLDVGQQESWNALADLVGQRFGRRAAVPLIARPVPGKARISDSETA
jgi:NAD(P)-dependent dehydrogenase (short-subunit alcohol dehydrogenase family)